MTRGLFSLQAAAPTSPGLSLRGDWSVGHFVAATPRLGSDPDIRATTIVAHAEQVFTDGRWLFAHEGALGAYGRLEPTLWAETDPRLRAHRSGEGESELIFLWLLSRLASFGLGEPGDAPLAQLVEGVRDAVQTLAGWAKEAGASEPAGLTEKLSANVRHISRKKQNVRPTTIYT